MVGLDFVMTSMKEARGGGEGNGLRLVVKSNNVKGGGDEEGRGKGKG